MLVKKSYFNMEKKSGVRRIGSAMANSFSGLSFLIKKETAFRQEIVLTAVLLPLAFWIGETAIEVSLLVLTVGFILVIEALNTAIEKTVDRIGLERNLLSGIAKDVGSAAVLISFVIAVAIWGIIIIW